MNNEERKKIAHRNANEAIGEYMSDHSVAVWQQDPEGDEFFGSAVPLEIGGRLFLASAAHNFEVLLKNGRVTLFSARRSSRTPLVEIGHNYSRYGATDTLDIAWIEVDPTSAAKSALSAIPARLIEPHHRIDPKAVYGNYEVTGFPTGLAKTEGNETTVRLMIFNTIPAQNPHPEKDELLLDYREAAYAQSLDTDHGLTNVPEPHGVSGGGMWYTPSLEASQVWGPSMCRLVGIVTHYWPIRRQIVGIPIQHWLMFLQDDHPELENHIQSILTPP